METRIILKLLIEEEIGKHSHRIRLMEVDQ